MVSTIPARVPLGASTTARKWYVDVYAADNATILGVFGISEFKFHPGEATTQDNSDFDGEGWGSDVVTALKWGGEGKLQRKSTAANAQVYDPGQERLRVVARTVGARARVRVYEVEPSGPRAEAYDGYVSVTWDQDGGDMAALDTVSFKLLGQGKPTVITHPADVVATPVITGLSANGKGAAGTITIRGQFFTGVVAANVKINNIAMTSIEVVDDYTIMAVLPAGAAGTYAVQVGASNTLPYTRT